MNVAHPFTGKKCTPPTVTTRKPRQRFVQRGFCLNTNCLTDELTVYRVSPKADVWLLTDEQSDHSWLMMGRAPVCPHCGMPLVK